MVSWYETVLHGRRDTTYEIHAQIYDAGGAAMGREIKVRTGSEGVPDHSAVTALDGGGFMVVYRSEFLDGDDETIAGRIHGPVAGAGGRFDTVGVDAFGGDADPIRVEHPGDLRPRPIVGAFALTAIP